MDLISNILTHVQVSGVPVEFVLSFDAANLQIVSAFGGTTVATGNSAGLFSPSGNCKDVPSTSGVCEAVQAAGINITATLNGVADNGQFLPSPFTINVA